MTMRYHLSIRATFAFDADADRSISIQRKRGTNNMRDEHVAAAVAQF